jgi:hypothetical protein
MPVDFNRSDVQADFRDSIRRHCQAITIYDHNGG